MREKLFLKIIKQKEESKKKQLDLIKLTIIPEN